MVTKVVYYKSKDGKRFDNITQAIEHENTLCENYDIKNRVCKHCKGKYHICEKCLKSNIHYDENYCNHFCSGKI